MTKNASIIPINMLVESSIGGFEKNLFIQHLRYGGIYPFDSDDIWEVIKMYRLGTIDTGYMFGGTIFPYIDEWHKVRAMQVKEFDQANYETRTDFLPSMILRQSQRDKKEPPEWVEPYQVSEHKLACLFGTHLLREYPKNTVAVVAKPDVAIYASLYLGNPKPDGTGLLWLSAYNYETLSIDRCMPLKGRNIVLFPDLSPAGAVYKLWKERAARISSRVPLISVTISDLLQNAAPDNALEIGMITIADYLRQFDWRDFRDNEPIMEEKSTWRPEMKSETKPMDTISVIKADDSDCPF